MARTKVTAAEASQQPQSRRSWAPDHEDHFIYWWVKHQGQTQITVASQLGISQGTVSRTIQRYERWQTRAEAQSDGRLTHAERLRAQRWLTYERNELIVASCLRIAGEMEGIVDVSSSVVQRPLSQPEAEREVRRTHSTMDRHGLASRFLRLAYRINMDNFKLVQQDELPPLDPLTPEQLAAEEASAEQLRAERAAAKRGGLSYYDEQREKAQQREAEIREADRRQQEEWAAAARLRQVEESERAELAREILAGQTDDPAALAAAHETAALVTEVPSPQVSTKPPPAVESSDPQPVAPPAASAHKAHNDAPENPAATSDQESTCNDNGHPKKTSRPMRMNGQPPVAATKRKSRPEGQQAVAELRVSPDAPAAIAESR